MGKFILGFILGTATFVAFAVMYYVQDAAFIDATCSPSSEPSALYIEDGADRELVCRYLKREVGLDQ